MTRNERLVSALNGAIDGTITTAEFATIAMPIIDELVKIVGVDKSMREDVAQETAVSLLEKIEKQDKIQDKDAGFFEWKVRVIIERKAKMSEQTEALTAAYGYGYSMDEEMEKAALRNLLEEKMNKHLPQRELEMLKLYYGFEGEEKNFREIGEMYNISGGRAEQIVKKALTRMRRRVDNLSLKDFLY